MHFGHDLPNSAMVPVIRFNFERDRENFRWVSSLHDMFDAKWPPTSIPAHWANMWPSIYNMMQEQSYVFNMRLLRSPTDETVRIVIRQLTPAPCSYYYNNSTNERLWAIELEFR